MSKRRGPGKYHAGDLTEGVNMRRGHEYEVFKHGVFLKEGA